MVRAKLTVISVKVILENLSFAVGLGVVHQEVALGCLGSQSSHLTRDSTPGVP